MNLRRIYGRSKNPFVWYSRAQSSRVAFQSLMTFLNQVVAFSAKQALVEQVFPDLSIPPSRASRSSSQQDASRALSCQTCEKVTYSLAQF